MRDRDITLPSSITLGRLVGELFDSLGFTELLAPPPWGVRLNQWRNMAQHHRTRVEGNTIIGFFGEPPNEKTLPLSRDDLMEALRSIVAIFNAIKLARTIFCIDNIEQIRPLLPKIPLREDARLLSLVTGISSQGFKVTNILLTDTESILELIDLQDTSKQRVIHASQFLLPLWTNTERANLIIRYSNQLGDYTAEFRTTGKACSQLSNNEITLDEYISIVSFTVPPI